MDALDRTTPRAFHHLPLVPLLALLAVALVTVTVAYVLAEADVISGRDRDVVTTVVLIAVGVLLAVEAFWARRSGVVGFSVWAAAVGGLLTAAVGAAYVPTTRALKKTRSLTTIIRAGVAPAVLIVAAAALAGSGHAGRSSLPPETPSLQAEGPHRHEPPPVQQVVIAGDEVRRLVTELEGGEERFERMRVAMEGRLLAVRESLADIGVDVGRWDRDAFVPEEQRVTAALVMSGAEGRKVSRSGASRSPPAGAGDPLELDVQGLLAELDEIEGRPAELAEQYPEFAHVYKDSSRINASLADKTRYADMNRVGSLLVLAKRRERAGGKGAQLEYDQKDAFFIERLLAWGCSVEQAFRVLVGTKTGFAHASDVRHDGVRAMEAMPDAFKARGYQMLVTMHAMNTMLPPQNMTVGVDPRTKELWADHACLTYLKYGRWALFASTVELIRVLEASFGVRQLSDALQLTKEDNRRLIGDHDAFFRSVNRSTDALTFGTPAESGSIEETSQVPAGPPQERTPLKPMRGEPQQAADDDDDAEVWKARGASQKESLLPEVEPLTAARLQDTEVEV
jgi:hypothetical protein